LAASRKEVPCDQGLAPFAFIRLVCVIVWVSGEQRKEAILLPDGTEKIVTMPQEKGADIRLALDVVSPARKRQFDVALIFSQDQDLAELVQELIDISNEQARWIKIACTFPSGPNATSSRGINGAEWVRLDQILL
jgi:hypothetical protein